MNRAHPSKKRRIEWPALLRSLSIQYFCAFLVAFFFPAAVFSASIAHAEPARVLVIHSYHKGLAWTDNIMGGMDAVFANSGLETEIYVEYLDTKRFPLEASFPYLEDMFRRKYHQIDFDIILLSDNNALNFALSRRDALFPDVPIVFCGVNHYQKALLGQHASITGVAEEIDIRGTVSLALRILPGLKRFVIVNDRTPTGRENLKKFQEVAPEFSDRSVRFEVWDDMTAEELKSRLSGLPSDAAVLVFTFHRTRDGDWLSIPGFLKLIRESSPTPIFSFWAHYLGQGVLGGIMVDGEVQGRKCAEYAVRILNGESADAIPVLFKSPNVPLLDYRQLRRFSIPESRLPEGSIVAFAPTPFLELDRTAVSGAVFGILGLIAFTIYLLLNNMRRRRIENRLAESEKRYRLLAENASDVIWTMDTHHRHTFVSPSAERLTGYRPDELPHIPLEKRFTPASFKIAQKLIHERQKRWREGMPDDETNRMELEQIRKDGGTVWTEIISNIMMGEDGKPVGIIGVTRDISDRKRMEKKLRESEAKFKAVYDAMPLCLALWRFEENDFILSDINPATIDLSGAKIQEWLGTPLSVFYKDSPWLIEAIHRARVEGETIHMEGISKLRTTAKEIFLKLSFAPISKDMVMAVAEDITQTKEAERLLKESEEKFQKAFHSCPAFMSISTLEEGRFIEVNSEFLKLVGFSREEVVGRRASDLGLWDKNEREPVLTEIEQTGYAHAKEIEIRSKTGKAHNILWFGDVVVIGGQQCIVASGYDQTARKRAEDELQKYRQIVSTSPDAMAYLDHEYRYRIVNAAYETFSNTKREAFLGKTVSEYLGEEVFRDQIKSHFDRCLAGETIQYEDWFDYPTLGRRYVQVTYFPFKNSADEISGIVANTRDLTELKLAQEKVQQYANRLEELVIDRTRELEKAQEELLIRERLAVLGHFAGSISHELRNPLGAIDSSIYFLKMKLGTADEKIAEHLARIRKNIHRATAIIESLLNLSRMERPKTRPHVVNRLISDTLHAARIPVTVRVKTVYPKDEIMVEADPDQIRIALKNILHNAVQAMEGDGVLTISVRPGDEGQVEISISDTGPGVPPENLEKIFQPLFSTKVHGIGFGLSIAKMIIEKHGGSLSASSAPGGGAALTIELPTAKRKEKET